MLKTAGPARGKDAQADASRGEENNRSSITIDIGMRQPPIVFWQGEAFYMKKVSGHKMRGERAGKENTEYGKG